MELHALPSFFIVKIERGKQQETRKYDEGLAISQNYVFMQHEVQNGEIVSIGALAKKEFPTAETGHTLLFHHFVTGKGIEDRIDSPHLLCSDEKYNYYKVTICSFNGERNLSYGVWDGDKIIPHKDFIFLEIEIHQKEVAKNDELVEIKNWSESRDLKGVRMKEIKNTIGELTKTKANDDLKHEIEKREKVMDNISKGINKKQILLYKVAYSNYDFQEVGMLNIACNTKVLFFGKEYIVAPSKYLHFGISKN